MSEYGNIIKESVYAFERIARYCVYDYENECNLFFENLRSRIYESSCNHDEHFNLIRFLGLLKVLSNHKDLPEKVCQIPYYFRDYLLEYRLMPDNVIIFPQNKCTTYFIDGPNISLIPNNGIINKKAFVANATKISDNLIVTSFIENVKYSFLLNGERVHGDLITGLQGNFITDCPYTLETLKFLITDDRWE